MNAPTRKLPAPKNPELVESTFTAAKDAMDSLFGPSAATKALETGLAQSRANLAAVGAVGSALVAGVQEINQAWLALAQDAVDDGVVALRRVTACKSTPELLAAQGELAQASYAKFASKGQTLHNLTTKLAENVSAPVVARAEAAMTMLTKPTAA